MASWIQHPVTGKLIPREEYVRPRLNASAAVMGDLEAFVSPIDGTLIDDRGKLRAHNKRHGVTNCADYSPEFYEKKRQQREKEQKFNKQDFADDFNRAVQIHGGS